MSFERREIDALPFGVLLVAAMVLGFLAYAHQRSQRLERALGAADDADDEVSAFRVLDAESQTQLAHWWPPLRDKIDELRAKRVATAGIRRVLGAPRLIREVRIGE